MPAALLPANEQARLASLRALDILDTPPDPRFDAFTRLAARACRAPIALISLVDADRQWFKAGYGLDRGVCETSRDQAFCAHTILRPEDVLVVQDATRDARFADNPLVTGDFHLRAYAGAPLVAPDGSALGSLCVLDRRPRRFSSTQLATLRDLADGVMGALHLHAATRKLQAVAARDPLTGVASRSHFEDRLAAALARAAGPERVRVAVLLVDLDRFKLINDCFGHAAGDAALCAAAHRMSSVLRQGDLLARLGGDEFAMLCEGLSAPSDADAIGARALAALGEPFEINGQPIGLHGSIGIAVAPDDGTGPEELVAAADAAMYSAKRGGRGRAARHVEAGVAAARDTTAGQEEAASRPGGRRSLSEDLHHAVQTGEGFTLVFQPVVEAAGGAVHCYEALLRWQRPGTGPVPPSEFIPVAEGSGLVMALDRWVLRAACAQAACWQQQVKLAVNISPIHLRFGDLEADVRQALAASGLAPDRLVMEITESAAISEAERALAMIEQLRSIGVQLALDDFGAGHGSLLHLQQFPFDIVKLDRGIVAALGKSPRAAAVLRAALQMGKALGATTLAEGVETEAEAHLLRAEGCDLLQGYLFGRPAPIGHFAQVARYPATVVG